MSTARNLIHQSPSLFDIQRGTSKLNDQKLLRPAFSTPRGVLYHTDCMRLFATLRSDAIDCLFADPPFNLGKDYGKGSSSDSLAREEYLHWCCSWLTESVRVIKPGGTIFIYILPQWGFHFAAHLESRGMMFRHWIAISMKGTFPRGNKLYPAHYAILYFSKGIPKCFNKIRVPIPVCRHCGKDIKDYGGHRKYLNPEGLSLTDFWDDTAPARHQKFKSRWHINELKPVIPSRCIEMSTNCGDVVLDPFGGGGSTFEAAERLDRNWIGSEIGNCTPIIERLERQVTQIRKPVPVQLRPLFIAADVKMRLSLTTDAQDS
jgi:site-specific DNA-methyltransferase (adenine-specific)